MKGFLLRLLCKKFQAIQMAIINFRPLLPGTGEMTHSPMWLLSNLNRFSSSSLSIVCSVGVVI